MTWKASLLTAAALALEGGAALAASPDGDWIGTMPDGARTTILGLEVRADHGGHRASYDLIGRAYLSFPLKASEPLDFRARDGFGDVAFRWDAAAGDWAGSWRNKSGDHPVTLKRGVIPPRPPMSQADRIALAVILAMIALEAVAIARLLLRRRRSRLSAAKSIGRTT